MRLTTTASGTARRGLTTAAVATLLITLGACSSDGGAETGEAAEGTTELTVGSAPSLSGLGLRVGISEGLFEEHGLEVTATPNRSANETVPQLLNGELDIAQMDTITFLQAAAQGLPVKIVAGAGVQSTDGEDGEMSAASVVTAASSDITGAVDLVGKKVGVPAIKTQTWMNIRAIVDDAGGDSSKIEFLEVPPAQMVDLVQRGDVDAATPNEPLGSTAISSGAVRLVHNTDAPGNKGVPSSIYVATAQFVAENPDAVKAFAEGVQEAGEKVNSDRALATEVAQSELDFTPEQLQNAFFQTLATEPVTGEDIDAITDLAVTYEILTEKPDAEALLADVA